MNIEQRELTYGSKTLSVCINTDVGSASIRFGTRGPQWLHRRIKRETTTIFQLGEEIVQKEAQALQTPIRLSFDTANINLKSWALAHKNDLLFDSVQPEDPTAYRVTITKTYFPG